MNRKILFVQVAAIHLILLGFLFGLMNGCERKRQGDYRLPAVSVTPQEVPKEVPKEIVEKEEPLLIKEYGRPGVVKHSEVSGGVKSGAKERVHEVEKGETLSEIAQDYGVSLKTVMELNDIRDAGKIRVGQKLIIPGDS